MIDFDVWLARPWWTLEEACWLAFDIQPPLYPWCRVGDAPLADDVADFLDAAELAATDGRLPVESAANGAARRIEPLAFLQWALPYRRDGLPVALRDAVMSAAHQSAPRVERASSAAPRDHGHGPASGDEHPRPVTQEAQPNAVLGAGGKPRQDLSIHNRLEFCEAALAVIAADARPFLTSEGKLIASRIANAILAPGQRRLLSTQNNASSADVLARALREVFKKVEGVKQ